MLAEVLAFYHLGWEELLEMEMTWFCHLYNTITLVEARRLLPLLDIQMYPHLTKKQDRQRLVEGLQRRAGYKRLQYLASFDTQRANDGWARLRGMSAPRNGDTHG